MAKYLSITGVEALMEQIKRYNEQSASSVALSGYLCNNDTIAKQMALLFGCEATASDMTEPNALYWSPAVTPNELGGVVDSNWSPVWNYVTSKTYYRTYVLNGIACHMAQFGALLPNGIVPVSKYDSMIWKDTLNEYGEPNPISSVTYEDNYIYELKRATTLAFVDISRGCVAYLPIAMKREANSVLRIESIWTLRRSTQRCGVWVLSVNLNSGKASLLWEERGVSAVTTGVPMLTEQGALIDLENGDGAILTE